MIIALIFAVILLLLMGFVMFNFKKTATELKQKSDFALQSDTLVKIEHQGGGALNGFADNFNKLAKQYQELKIQFGELEALRTEKIEWNTMVKSVEKTLNQVNLINDIGRKITSSLYIKDILKQVTHVVSSTAKVTEIHYLIYNQKGEGSHFMSADDLTSEVSNNNWLDHKNNILTWSYQNNKEVFLRDALNDYGQYVFEPITMYNGKQAQSVIVVPFLHQNKISGCVGLFSSSSNEYDHYLLDFVASITTYLSVALDNSTLYSELDLEKGKSEKLLLNILPRNIAEELLLHGKSEPRYHEKVTVMFMDFKNFTYFSEQFTATGLVNEIDYLFKNFDEIMERNEVEKIKTIGDAYMCATGLDNDTNHAEKMVKAAIEIQLFMREYAVQRKQEDKIFFEARIGIHSGNVVSGVVGKTKFAFDVWGDTVNMASRMESSSETGKINLSGSTYELIKNSYACEYRGKIQAKNKGEIDMYFVQHG